MLVPIFDRLRLPAIGSISALGAWPQTLLSVKGRVGVGRCGHLPACKRHMAGGLETGQEDRTWGGNT